MDGGSIYPIAAQVMGTSILILIILIPLLIIL